MKVEVLYRIVGIGVVWGIIISTAIALCLFIGYLLNPFIIKIKNSYWYMLMKYYMGKKYKSKNLRWAYENYHFKNPRHKKLIFMWRLRNIRHDSGTKKNI